MKLINKIQSSDLCPIRIKLHPPTTLIHPLLRRGRRKLPLQPLIPNKTIFKPLLHSLNCWVLFSFFNLIIFSPFHGLIRLQILSGGCGRSWRGNDWRRVVRGEEGRKMGVCGLERRVDLDKMGRV